MIPSDLAARLRLLTEASFFDSEPPLQGPARAREIQARLPALQPGERYTAALQRALPDGTFQAVIAGKTYTLALNNAAAAGDTVELVVTKNTPNTVFAQLATPAAASIDQGAAEASRPTLSAVGRLIGFLLTGQPAAKPIELKGGQPLLDAPPLKGAEVLAPVLRQAVSASGVFYESHQLQWISGKIPTAALLQEPQGQQPSQPNPTSQLNQTSQPNPSPPANPQTAFPGSQAAATAQQPPPLPGQQHPATNQQFPPPSATPFSAEFEPDFQPGPPGPGSPSLPTPTPPSPPAAEEAHYHSTASPLRETRETVTNAAQRSAALTESLDATEADFETTYTAAPSGSAAPRAAPIPERLMPVVHQQLDGMATQTYVWHGQVWPGQTIEWEIEDPQGERTDSAGDETATEWKTTLRLTLPRLGGLEARLVLTPAGVAMRLLADDQQTVAALDGARAQLDAALAAANVPLTGFVAERRDERQ